MRYSVQMYRLRSEQHEAILLNHLSLNIPLACKQAEMPLVPLRGSAELMLADKASQASLQFDSNTYAITLLSNGQKIPLQTDAEYTRLQHYFLKCWINLLQSRQATSTSRHGTEIADAQRALKGVSRV